MVFRVRCRLPVILTAPAEEEIAPHREPAPLAGYLFAIFRILTGAYLAFYSAMMLPYAADVFSSRGMLPYASMNDTLDNYPAFLLRLDTPEIVRALFIIKIAAALAFMLGICRRAAAALSWLILSWTLNRNNLIASPEIAYVGWALLASAVIPPGEPWSLGRRDPAWEFPLILRFAGWIILGVSYSYSGYAKLGSSEWVQGKALYHALTVTGAARTSLSAYLPSFGTLLFKVLSYLTVFLELGGIVWMVIPRARLPYWIATMLMHVGILLLLDLTQVSLGMMLFHLLLFDPNWLPAWIRRWAGEAVSAGSSIEAGQAPVVVEREE